MKAHFRELAAYNAWANTRLYGAATALPEGDWMRDLGAAFGGVGQTLNHIMVADLIWLSRFRGPASPPFALDHVLHDDPEELWAARRVLDRDVEAFVEGLSEAAIAAEFTYRTVTDRREVTQPLGPALAHLFNHQTHHRGQAHAMLTRLTGAAPALDLIYFQRERAAA